MHEHFSGGKFRARTFHKRKLREQTFSKRKVSFVNIYCFVPCQRTFCIFESNCEFLGQYP